MPVSQTKQLAIEGGQPVRQEPFPPRRLFGEEEKAAAMAVFDEAIATGTAFGYGGPHERAYEKAFAEYLGGGLAKAVNSGTSATLAALAALELEPESEVIVPPITDPGGVMPVVIMNCLPVPADTDGSSFNAGPEQIAAAITERTRAIIVAHIMGEPADMAPIMALARKHDLPVIEDAAQAHGATYRGRHVGTFGDLAAFSTMSGKHHASGAQGGFVFTLPLFHVGKRAIRDPDIAEYDIRRCGFSLRCPHPRRRVHKQYRTRPPSGSRLPAQGPSPPG